MMHRGFPSPSPDTSMATKSVLGRSSRLAWASRASSGLEEVQLKPPSLFYRGVVRSRLLPNVTRQLQRILDASEADVGQGEIVVCSPLSLRHELRRPLQQLHRLR